MDVRVTVHLKLMHHLKSTTLQYEIEVKVKKDKRKGAILGNRFKKEQGSPKNKPLWLRHRLEGDLLP